VTRGEPRSVHSFQSHHWFFPLSWACPNVMPNRTPHHRGITPAVPSEDRRARVGGPSEGRVFQGHDDLVECLVHTLGRMPTNVPLLGALRTSAVIGAPVCSGGIPLHACGPTEVLVPTTSREERRLPEDRDASHRHDTRRILDSRRDMTPSGLRAGSLAHAAHTLSPGWGQCC